MLIPIWFYSDMVKGYPEGCIMDALNVLRESMVFPILALIYGIWNMHALEKDNNVMTILLYSDRKKLWNSKCISVIVTAFSSSLLIVAGSMVSAGLYYSRWCNWKEEDSFFMEQYHGRSAASLHILNPAVIAIVSVATFFLLFLLTAMIGMLADAVTGNVVISILFFVIICGMDSLVHVTGGVPVLYCRFQVNLSMWIEPERIFPNTFVLCAMIFLIYMTGKSVFERREDI